MQFNRDDAGVMHPLPKPSRRHRHGPRAARRGAAARALELRDRPLPGPDRAPRCARPARKDDLKSPSLQVIADHIRACAFLVVDGVIPGNEGRGYVLRRIIRRAIRHGYKLGPEAAVLPQAGRGPRSRRWAMPIPSCAATEQRVARGAASRRRSASSRRSSNGMEILEAALAGERASVLDGETAFKLYDTFGFPVDLTADVCRERGVDGRHGRLRGRDGRSSASARAPRASSRSARSSSTRAPKTTFRGYETLSDEGRVVALYRDGSPVESLARRRARRRRARPHAVLRRVGRPGRRPRRAAQGRRVPHALRGRGHAEDPGRRVRPPRRASTTGELKVGDTVAAQRRSRERARGRCATTPRRT